MEKDLQRSLDDGASVWVIGDIHGFSVTFENLVDILQLSENDRVVVLGDLIDRGPDSYSVVKIVQADSRIYSTKGNHEQMMVEGFIPKGISHKLEANLWLRNGGIETAASYIRAFTNHNGEEDSAALEQEIIADKKWMNSLPAHVILDKWRLVHAGYDPRTDLDEQGEAEHLWIRTPFHNSTTAIDEQRCVVFGHTPTMLLFAGSDDSYGQIWYSDVRLEDGRAASIGIDTCLFHKQQLPAWLSAINLQTMEIKQMPRVEVWDDRERHLAKTP
ncbi:MAG: metallophosphoesterase [Candidatus Poseidoniaceae archaeon]